MPTPREVPALHGLTAGVVVLRENSVFAVYEKDRWGLLKDGSEPNRFFFKTAVRGAAEETGVEVEIQSLAFTGEIRAPDHRIYLQWFHHAAFAADSPALSPSDPGDEIEAAKLLPLTTLGSAPTYRPRAESLRDWLRDYRPRHYTYDPTRKSSDVEK